MGGTVSGYRNARGAWAEGRSVEDRRRKLARSALLRTKHEQEDQGLQRTPRWPLLQRQPWYSPTHGHGATSSRAPAPAWNSVVSPVMSCGGARSRKFWQSRGAMPYTDRKSSLYGTYNTHTGTGELSVINTAQERHAFMSRLAPSTQTEGGRRQAESLRQPRKVPILHITQHTGLQA